MLVHITPQLYLDDSTASRRVRLADLTIAEFGVSLQGGRELAVRRPFPNKRYLVACFRQPLRAVAGIIFDIDRLRARRFTVSARWLLDGGARIFAHQVRYELLDNEYDAVTDSCDLWSMRYGQTWMSRWPAGVTGPTNVLKPRMDMRPTPAGEAPRPSHVIDEHGPDGYLISRKERFRLPTVERERLADAARWSRFPALESALRLRTPSPRALLAARESARPSR